MFGEFEEAHNADDGEELEHVADRFDAIEAEQVEERRVAHERRGGDYVDDVERRPVELGARRCARQPHADLEDEPGVAHALHVEERLVLVGALLREELELRPLVVARVRWRRPHGGSGGGRRRAHLSREPRVALVRGIVEHRPPRRELALGRAPLILLDGFRPHEVVLRLLVRLFDRDVPRQKHRVPEVGVCLQAEHYHRNADEEDGHH